MENYDATNNNSKFIIKCCNCLKDFKPDTDNMDAFRGASSLLTEIRCPYCKFYETLDHR